MQLIIKRIMKSNRGTRNYLFLKSVIMKIKLALGMISFILISHSAFSQSESYYRYEYQHLHDRRSSDLSSREYKHLKREKAKIHRAKKRMLRDGVLDKRERHQLRKMKKQHREHLLRHQYHHQKRRCR